MSRKLEGKVTIVTGGSSGIGLATAKLFAAEGAHVFVTGRRQAELDAAVEDIGAHATGIRADSANLADIDRLYAVVKAQKGHVDVLFVNAGGGEFMPLGEITETHFDQTFDANVKGTLFTVQKALPILRDGGSIVLMSSAAGSAGIPAFSVYSAAKAAIRAFARGWILDLKDRGIRVNAVSPGPIATPGFDALAPDKEQGEQRARQIAAGIPLGRLGNPDEVARAVLFLASEDASFVSGVELSVDGGAGQI